MRELDAGRKMLIKIVQRETFHDEIEALTRSKPLKNSSSILRLLPFLGDDGLLRVGGRLQNSLLPEEEKHPLILPGHHRITKLLIREAHRITLHGGATMVQSHLFRRYWLVRGRNTIRAIIRACIKCARYRGATLEQQMGPLPAVRTRPARPFTCTGVDYAGPFLIKASPGRGQKCYKGYVAVFVCMVSRAVHLEVVSDLTSAAFLAAFRRFVGRRGLCKTIYSDNGTNFQGASSELHRLFVESSNISQEIGAQLARDEIEWLFIPPRAPNFGGLWEANVKTFKQHLKKVVGESKLTYEEFSTVTCMIEACLNSRPLSYLSSGAEEDIALTPGHFLTGAALTSPPEPFIDDNESVSWANRWKMLQLMRNHFWRRWHKEYLAQAQQRSKWFAPNDDIKVGDIVFFKDELTPPMKWPLARIIQLHPGKDGLSRVATIKTPTAEFKRPINKLIYLPVNENASAFYLQVRKSMGGDNSIVS